MEHRAALHGSELQAQKALLTPCDTCGERDRSAPCTAADGKHKDAPCFSGPSSTGERDRLP